MNVLYHVLYRNGHEDVIPQRFVSDEAQEIGVQINELIQESFREGYDGNLSLGDGETEGSFIRLCDVIRVRVEIVEETK